jgi:hypothetical protein
VVFVFFWYWAKIRGRGGAKIRELGVLLISF